MIDFENKNLTIKKQKGKKVRKGLLKNLTTVLLL